MEYLNNNVTQNTLFGSFMLEESYHQIKIQVMKYTIDAENESIYDKFITNKSVNNELLESELVEFEVAENVDVEVVESERVDVEVESEYVDDEVLESKYVEGFQNIESNKINISILGLELEEQNLIKYSLNQSVKISVETHFNSWSIVDFYLK
ncbi:9829_t:CDS:2, partial [Racocetra persica]